MERVIATFTSFADAERAEREAYWAMTPDERLLIGKILRERVHGKEAPDIRQSHHAR